MGNLTTLILPEVSSLYFIILYSTTLLQLSGPLNAEDVLLAAVTALLAITARSTQDLWRAPQGESGEGTAEQQAQRRANEVRTLSKRSSGNVKAKEELPEALSMWLVQISQHLQSLVSRATSRARRCSSRVKAIGSKIDEDLMAACQEMGISQEAQSSLTTADRIANAMSALGVIWKHP